MRWTRSAVVLMVGLFALTAAIQPAGAQSRDGRDAAANTRQEKRNDAKQPVHQEYDSHTGATLTSTVDAQGNARFAVTAGDFLLEKTVASTGDTTIRISQGKDVVTIAMNHGGYVVARGKRSARFDPQTAQPDALDTVRSIMLGSTAVRSFRRLSAALENRDETEDDGPLILGTLVDGAIVQMLDGDLGATSRIGKRITRKQRAAMRPAKFTPDTFTDCILNYELSLMEAWDLLSLCESTAWNTPWYVWYFASDLCELEFLIRSQQYMSQFMACFAYPF